MSHAPAASDPILGRPRPACPLCGRTGTQRYDGLRDHQFGAPGAWRLVRCPDEACNVLWLDPVPLAEDIGKAYRTYHTHLPARDPSTHWIRRARRAVRDGFLSIRYGYDPGSPRALKRLLGLALYLAPDRREDHELQVLQLRALREGRLLDVGCGSGATLLTMQERGWRVEGVDFDARAVDAARASGLEVRLGSLESQQYPERSFDAVTMVHLIEHVHDPVALVRESHRILKPGGRLAILTPNARSWGHAVFGPAWRGLEPPRHLQIFTPSALRTAVETAGFRQCLVRTSARSRAFIYRQSMALLSHQPRGSRLRARVKAEALLFRLAGRLRLATSPESGEEIVLLATK